MDDVLVTTISAQEASVPSNVSLVCTYHAGKLTTAQGRQQGGSKAQAHGRNSGTPGGRGDGKVMVIFVSDNPATQILRTTGGKVMVIFVSDSPATQISVHLALSIMRATKDIVYFVSVAQTKVQQVALQEMCDKYAVQAKATLATPHVDILQRDSRPLAEQLEDYVTSMKADLVVMGSHGLSEANSLGIGSLTLALLKTISKPLLVVKANAKNAELQWSKDKLKVMVQVEHTSRPLLHYVCSNIVLALRYDKLLLARGGASDKSHQETTMCRRLLDNFNDVAAQHHFDGSKHPLDGPWEVDGVKLANTEKVHVMAMNQPAGRTLSEKTMKMLKSTRSAVLLFRGKET
eukprot:gene95-3703_t